MIQCGFKLEVAQMVFEDAMLVTQNLLEEGVVIEQGFGRRKVGIAQLQAHGSQNGLRHIFVDGLGRLRSAGGCGFELGKVVAETVVALGGLFDQLREAGLTAATSVVTAYASPRRLAAHVTQVAAQAADKAIQQKLMPVAVGLDASGNASPALLKKLQALGADVSHPAAVVASLKRAPDGKAEALFYDSVAKGASLLQGLQKALDEALAKLPIPKVMTYQLETDCEMPGWSSVNFVRPAHGLVALHGKDVVPVKTLGLKAGQQTHGHRFEAAVSPVVIQDADSYAATLARDGAVIASFSERRAEIVRQLNAAAAKVGGFLANNSNPVDFIYQNLAIQNNVITSSFENGIEKLLFLGSSCIYPKICPQPIKEE